MNINDDSNVLYDEAKHLNISFEKDFTYLIETLKNVSHNPSFIYHTYLLIKRRITCNFSNFNFYIRQFFIPLILCSFGCIISNFLVNNISLTSVNNLYDFSQSYPFVIPITHENIGKKEEFNSIFVHMMNEYKDFNLNKYFEKFNDSREFKVCQFDPKFKCELNKIPLDVLRHFLFNYETLKNKNHMFYAQILKKCDMDRFLLLTKDLYAYKR